VPDGFYLLRLTASDAPDNPQDMARTASRLSDPILVDNTPPDVADLRVDRRDGRVAVAATLTDALSPVASLAYALGSADDYQTLLPEDLIADSTTEAFSFTLPGSTQPGTVLTLRVTDTRGNATYKAVPVP